MAINRHNEHGFTLTELLLVVTLLGIAMLLVGPLTVEQIDKFQRKNEMFTLERMLKKLSFEAFVKVQPIHLYLNGKAVYLLDASQLPQNLNRQPDEQMIDASSVKLSSNQQPYYVFERLFFKEQLLSLNVNGFYQSDVLHVQAGQQTEDFLLNPHMAKLGVVDGH